MGISAGNGQAVKRRRWRPKQLSGLYVTKRSGATILMGHVEMVDFAENSVAPFEITLTNGLSVRIVHEGGAEKAEDRLDPQERPTMRFKKTRTGEVVEDEDTHVDPPTTPGVASFWRVPWMGR